MPRQPRQRGRRNRRTPLYKRLVPTQGDGPSYSNQQITVLDVPCDVFTLITSGAGLIATVFNINASNLQANFHGYFNTVFQEYRIRRVVFHVVAIGQNTGASLFRFEEKNASAPTLNEMANSTSRLVSHDSSSPKSTFSMTWTARDLVDLGFEQISTDPTSAYFKVYTDTAHFGAQSTTQLWLFRPVATIEFRGIGLN
jgi:hypothetical protein